MWFPPRFRSRRSAAPHPRAERKARQRPFRPLLEQLEDRTLPSNYTAASVSALIHDINAANQHGGSNTIMLAAATTFQLTTVNDTTDGPTGLPIIAVNDNLTIVGNGDTIERSTASGTPAFRLFDVASGASLTLKNVTLQGGLEQGAGLSAEGGAILNQGTLDLNGVTIQNNIARGQNGASYSAYGQQAKGGGIYSNGALTLEGGTTVQNNHALGGAGAAGRPGTYTGVALRGGNGGDAFGGGVYVAGGTVTVTSATVSSNTAYGGNAGRGGDASWGRRGANGGNGGAGLGGGLYVGGGTVELRSDTVQNNSAQGGLAGQGGFTGGTSGLPGPGEGGGIYIWVYGASSVCLDAFTVANTVNNAPGNIDGSYTVCL
jgi:hypothetical protein